MEAKLTSTGIEGNWDAHREGGIGAVVTEGEVRDDGDLEIGEAIAQNLFHCKTVGMLWVTLAEASQGDAPDLLECTGGAPLGKHAVDAVGFFRYIFDRQDGILQGRLCWGEQQMSGDSKVGWQQQAPSNSSAPALSLEGGERSPFYPIKQALLRPLRLRGQSGEDGGMNA